MGICVGMQLLADQSSEFEINEGLKWIPGEVMKLESNKNFPIPHMGWNEVEFIDHPLFNNCFQKSDFYFVHSYHVVHTEEGLKTFSTNYGKTFTSGLQSSNCIATQFHPEKSQVKGLQLYRNFLEKLSNP